MTTLIYTLAFDPPSVRSHAFMAKLLAASLQRTNFTGDIVIFRNSPEPIFKSAREGIREIFLPELHEGWANTMAWKCMQSAHPYAALGGGGKDP